MNIDQELDTVAEAICEADPNMQGARWPGKTEVGKDRYRRMAQAAIDAALGSLFEGVTRVDVIGDWAGQREHWADSWILSRQDEGRTLKLFAQGGHGAMAQAERNRALPTDLGLGAILPNGLWVHDDGHVEIDPTAERIAELKAAGYRKAGR